MQNDRTFGGVALDLLDRVGNAFIDDRLAERSSEREEGLTEFANPATVTQPVNRSQFPSGQPVVNNVGSNAFVLTPTTIGIMTLLVLGIAFVVRRL